jgi:uncharacterized protein RhaS with RHS repeats
LYLIGRYYDPVTGEFVTVDPEIATTEQPYSYVGDDPVNRSDPSGLAYFPFQPYPTYLRYVFLGATIYIFLSASISGSQAISAFGYPELDLSLEDGGTASFTWGFNKNLSSSIPFAKQLVVTTTVYAFILGLTLGFGKDSTTITKSYSAPLRGTSDTVSFNVTTSVSKEGDPPIDLPFWALRLADDAVEGAPIEEVLVEGFAAVALAG